MKNRNQIRKRRRRAEGRLGSLVLTVCLLAGMLPVTVKAAGHEHYLCTGGAACTEIGHTCTAETTFIEWTDTLAVEQNGPTATAMNSLPVAAGNYYLADNVTLDGVWAVTQDITLCLNGKTVSYGGTSLIDNFVTVRGNEAKLTLTDCSPEESGKLNANSKGRVICVGENYDTYSGELYLYGGSITGGRRDAVVVDSTGYAGGGIYICAKAVAVMYGGRITGNAVVKQEGMSASGGGVFVDGKFTMYDGKISGNSAGEEGGQPYNAKGGGVCLGNLYAETCFYMCGGSITENTVCGNANAGGGIYARKSNTNNNKLWVSGNVNITGNTAGTAGKANNLFLDDESELQIGTDGLGENARIGLTSAEWNKGNAFSVVSGVDNSYNGKLSLDSDSSVLYVVDGQVQRSGITLSAGSAVRVSGSEASVTFTAAATAAGSAQGSCYWQAVEQGGAAPEITTTGTGISCSVGENTVTLSGLSGEGAKDVYLCVKAADGSVSNVLKLEIPAYTAPVTPSEPSTTPETPTVPETPTTPETPAVPETSGGEEESDAEDDDDEPEAETAAEVSQTPAYVTYIVQSGDSMSRIARRNGMSLALLRALNPQVTNPAKIWPGQVLILGQAGVTAKTPADTAADTAASAGEYTTVQRGDTLSGIAARNGLSLAQLRAWNPELFRQRYIFAGQRVRIR